MNSSNWSDIKEPHVSEVVDSKEQSLWDTRPEESAESTLFSYPCMHTDKHITLSTWVKEHLAIFMNRNTKLPLIIISSVALKDTDRIVKQVFCSAFHILEEPDFVF